MKAVRIGAIVLVGVALMGGYLAVGLFQVEPDEQAVILRIGRHVRTVGPGLHWHAAGLETVESHVVTATRNEEFGYRTVTPGPPPEYEDRPEEKRMLTADANLVNVEFVVQYRVTNLADYLFHVKDASQVIRDVAQAAMRDVVARNKIDGVLTDVRGPIEQQGREQIQQVLDQYGAGIEIQGVLLQDVEPPEPVKDTFADVAGAQQDRARQILEARGYAEQVVPLAKGKAEEVRNQARAYHETRIRNAEGDAERFNALLVEYRKAPKVTRVRLYLETLESVLENADKFVMEKGQSEKVLPYLPLGRKESAKKESAK